MGMIVFIVGVLLFLSVKIIGRKKHQKMGEELDKDFVSLLNQTLLLVKIMAALLVAAGAIMLILI